MSLELVETCSVVVDRMTPQLGYIGVAARETYRPEHPLFGPPGSLQFGRIGAGVALAFDGRQLLAGLGADANLAFLAFGSGGVDVRLDGFAFDLSNVSNNAVVLLTAGYVFSPVANRPYRPSRGPVRDESKACRDAEAYRAALKVVREQQASACKSEGEDCERIRAQTVILNKALNKCLLGVDVGPPEETGDAP